METLISYLREIIGIPDFYIEGTNSYNATWDYGAMLEYLICGVIVCIIIASVFKLLRSAFK